MGDKLNIIMGIIPFMIVMGFIWLAFVLNDDKSIELSENLGISQISESQKSERQQGSWTYGKNECKPVIPFFIMPNSTVVGRCNV